jgi:hypothetical protein
MFFGLVCVCLFHVPVLLCDKLDQKSEAVAYHFP